MIAPAYRREIEDFIRRNAKPADKFSHQPRLYRLATQLAESRSFDDDVLHAAAWMHDLGVFIGHRPEDPELLAKWDHVAYATKAVPPLLQQFGFPTGKIDAVLEVIRTHLPSASPTTFEGVLMRDADILEQLGSIGVLRTVSKIGRDTRFCCFADALRVLRKNLDELPGRLKLPAARKKAEPRIAVLRQFLESALAESGANEGAEADLL